MNPYPNGWPTNWYQGQYNPHVYVPPYHNQPPYQPARWQGFNFEHSQPKSKWPSLNPTLASDMTYVRYDIRKPAREAIMLTTWQQIHHIPAFVAPTYEILIISKAFPWSMLIRAPAGSVVTCGAIFEGLHEMLHKHIEDSEWAIVALDKTRREAIEKAAKARQEKDKDKRLKRIDWLGDTPMFKGLEKDEEFEKKRHLPGSDTVAETWVVRFGKP
ncbi:uncharacterized protein HD556DRAFT_747007 [Suillus plorans]|uniref:DUF6699 domain-containing protein n=1 Tax=Suillus plorans TaxID=116603 RepID=A0A9P7DEU7_9AGAM|nr:uncharacterized protein HD556DRAFT_747007 [Suillus plorans]KAG1790071.1 hypothetical protein HD556DRAFT_747007 [Suillus plorans]